MARRRPTKRARARRAPNRGRRLLVGALLALFGLSVAYGLYLDFDIRAQFDGKRWAVPARVYARPLELYPGLQLSPGELLAELGLLGYRQVSDPGQPGSYARQGGGVLLHTRGFEFSDGAEPGRVLELQFAGGRLSAMRDAQAHRPIDLARLEPLYIGGIYPGHKEDRILVRVDQVPPMLVGALLATEDREFMNHYGVDFRAIARAGLANLRAGRTVQGGSTITQQLVKNYFLSNDRTLWRKANEAVMSLLLEWHYGKEEILEAYLNEVYLGQDGGRAIHGVGLASQFYFGRSVKQLSLPQMATLVALIRGPSYYDPHRQPQRLLARRNHVLQMMASEGLIDEVEAVSASRSGLGVQRRPSSGMSRYPAFMDLVRDQLRRDYRDEDLGSDGLRIFTTLDPAAQQAAEQGLSEQIRRLQPGTADEPARLQGAMVMTRPDTGEVLAVVGGRDPRFPGFNRALNAQRPVGSLIKPAIFLTALSDPARYDLLTAIEDTPLQIPNTDGSVWSPGNYDGTSHGSVPMYQALVHSYNQASVRLGMDLGVERVRDTLVSLGLERSVPAYPSLLLGAVALSPYEIAQIYQTLANGGFRTPLRAIREVLTAEGEPLQRYSLNVSQAVDPAAVAILNSALQEVVRSGTGRGLRAWLAPELHVAGKTGTTDDLRDSWFAGFSGTHLGVVWLGRDDNASINLTGSSGALRVWGQAVSQLRTGSLVLAMPDKVEHVLVDTHSLLLADRACPEVVALAFAADTGPREAASCAQRGPAARTVDWLRGLF